MMSLSRFEKGVQWIAERPWLLASLAATGTLVWYISSSRSKRRRELSTFDVPPKKQSLSPLDDMVIDFNGPFSDPLIQATHHQVDLDIVKLLIDRMATSPVNSSTQESILPPFPEQIHHLLQEIQLSKRPRKMLLVEGATGIGKGTALEYYIAQESGKRPSIYVRLSTILNKKHGGSSIGDDEGHETVSSSGWRQALEKTFGYDLDLSTENDGAMRHSFLHIYHALYFLRSHLSGPCLLVIDDVQLLFHRREALSNMYQDIEETFEWLRMCQQNDVLDVIFCSSEKSCLVALKGFRGFDTQMTFRSLEAVQDHVIIQYLMQKVNPILGQDTKEATDTKSSAKSRSNLSLCRKFTPETARLFVSTFDGNLIELEMFCQSGMDVKEYIHYREQGLLAYLGHETNAVIKLSGVASSDLRAVVLQMILGNGILAVERLDRSKLNVVEILVEHNFLRWRNDVTRKREKSSPVLSESDWIPLCEDDAYDVQMSSMMEKEDPLAMFQREGAELVWRNKLIGNVCEMWFNQQV